MATDRGIAYAGNKDNDRAIADYSEVIRIDPNYTVAFSNRGNLYEAQRRREYAIADFLRALAIDQNHELSRDALKLLGASPQPDEPMTPYPALPRDLIEDLRCVPFSRNREISTSPAP